MIAAHKSFTSISKVLNKKRKTGKSSPSADNNASSSNEKEVNQGIKIPTMATSQIISIQSGLTGLILFIVVNLLLESILNVIMTTVLTSCIVKSFNTFRPTKYYIYI